MKSWSTCTYTYNIWRFVTLSIMFPVYLPYRVKVGGSYTKHRERYLHMHLLNYIIFYHTYSCACVCAYRFFRTHNNNGNTYVFVRHCVNLICDGGSRIRVLHSYKTPFNSRYRFWKGQVRHSGEETRREDPNVTKSRRRDTERFKTVFCSFASGSVYRFHSPFVTNHTSTNDQKVSLIIIVIYIVVLDLPFDPWFNGLRIFTNTFILGMCSLYTVELRQPSAAILQQLCFSVNYFYRRIFSMKKLNV